MSNTDTGFLSPTPYVPPAIGGANQLYGLNADADEGEYKTLVAGSGVSIVHGVGSITIAATPASVEGDVNILDYGADPTGVSDSGAAITAAAAVVQAAGGGNLVFPPGTYKVFSTITTNLCTFTNLNGVNIIGKGATLAINTSRVFGAVYPCFFSFAGCKNVSVDGLRVTGNTISTVTGPYFVMLARTVGLYYGCQNVRVSNCHVTGVLAGLCATASSTDDDAYKAKNISVSNFWVENSLYGCNFQNSGSNVEIDSMRTVNVYRSYFPYGVRNHRVRINSNNSQGGDINLASGGAYGVLEDIDVTYVNVGSVSPLPASAHYWIMIVQIDGAASHKNIKINVNIDYTPTGAGEASAYGIILQCYNPGVGHVLENIEISGTINGDNIIAFVTTGMTSADYMRNIIFRNLYITNAVAKSYVNVEPLAGSMLLENVVSNKPIQFITSAGVETMPTSGRYKLINVDVENVAGAGSGGEKGLEVRAEPTSIAIPAGFQGHTITNVGATTTTTYSLPSAVVGMEPFRFIRLASQEVDLDPNGSEIIRGGSAGQYLSLDSDGSGVELKCIAAGVWERMQFVGSTSSFH